MSFLGMCSYCRWFIPNYAVLEEPLSAIAHGQGLQAYSKVTWTDDAEKAFTDMKLTLQSTLTLGPTTEVCFLRPDLQETPLQNPDKELFVDGSAFRNSDKGENQIGFSVVTAHDTLIAQPLHASLSAQAAELTALIEAFKLAEGKNSENLNWQ